MNRTLKLSLLCAGIFVCGAVAGGIGVRRLLPQGPQDNFGPRTMQRMVADLQLTDAQRENIEPKIRAAGEELRRLRRESWKQSGAVMEAMDAAIVAELTPEQRQRFEAIKAEQRAKMQAAMEERRRRDNRDGREGGQGAGENKNAPRPPAPGPDAPPRPEESR